MYSVVLLTTTIEPADILKSLCLGFIDHTRSQFAVEMCLVAFFMTTIEPPDPSKSPCLRFFYQTASIARWVQDLDTEKRFISCDYRTSYSSSFVCVVRTDIRLQHYRDLVICVRLQCIIRPHPVENCYLPVKLVRYHIISG
jgi:hypothetical protein